MSEINNLTSFSSHSHLCEQKLNEPLNQLGNFKISGISKTKAEEIKRLLTSVKLKREKYNVLQQYDSKSGLPVKVIKKELLEKYAFHMNSHDYNPQADILFGLSEIDVTGGASEESLRFPRDDLVNTSDLSKSVMRGFHDKLNIHPKKFEVLKALVSLHNEQMSTLSCLEGCKLTAIKVQELLLLKQQTAIKAAKTYQKGLLSLFIEAHVHFMVIAPRSQFEVKYDLTFGESHLFPARNTIVLRHGGLSFFSTPYTYLGYLQFSGYASLIVFLKYSILKDYFSEDKAVVNASIKLRESIASDFENLRWKEIDLQKKIEDFKKLKGPRFDQLLRDYKAVCESIRNKEWTLQNLLD